MLPPLSRLHACSKLPCRSLARPNTVLAWGCSRLGPLTHTSSRLQAAAVEPEAQQATQALAAAAQAAGAALNAAEADVEEEEEDFSGRVADLNTILEERDACGVSGLACEVGGPATDHHQLELFRS